MKKKKSSLDYPRLVREMFETSGDETICKLAAGLYVVATPIGHRGDISLRALVTLKNADVVACEDTRVSGLLFSAFGLKKELISYHDHNEAERIPELLTRIRNGEAVALVSDAGLPLISDPGFRLVSACRDEKLDVTVIPGANAALTALAGSGLPTNAFHFVGFLPPKASARDKVLKRLSGIPATLIFYESVQRLHATLDALSAYFGADRKAVVARELTKIHEETQTGSLSELSLYYRTTPARGELVILLAPPDPTAELSTEYDLEALLKEAMKTMSLRDAVAHVSAITGRKKNEVYAHALWISKGALPPKEKSRGPDISKY